VTRTAVAAAVCYRVGARGPRFLLVRTKGGRAWTFPKGHVRRRSGEAAWAAALREAREEAGVVGRVRSRRPLTYYAYAKRDTGKVDRVAAYLIDVVRTIEPQETFRTPTWASPARSRQLLAQRRRGNDVEEHWRVIDKALARLASASTNSAQRIDSNKV